jgi:hypothetical protein
MRVLDDPGVTEEAQPLHVRESSSAPGVLEATDVRVCRIRVGGSLRAISP